MKTQIFSILALSLAFGTSSYADTLRGKIEISGHRTLEYVYDTGSNAFALDATPLFEPRLISLQYTPVSRDKCDALRSFLRSDSGGLDADTIQTFYPSSPLSVKIQVADPSKAPEYALLVQADLKKQGKSVPVPKNATYLDRISLQLGFRWTDQALTVMGKHDLQAKAQKSLTSNFTYKDDESGITASANTNLALTTTLCDLQEKNLTLTAVYEYRNRFFYFDRQGLEPSTLFTIWKNLSTNSKWIDEVASKSDYLNNRDARLVAAGSLLSLEIMRSAPKTNLLQPDQFVKTFSAVFNTPTVEVSRFFNENTASELADRIGKPIEINLETIKGNIDL
jgi:hypothetical protein